MVILKKCSDCKIFKHVKEFNKCKGGKLGIHNWCRECSKKNSRKHYNKNRDYSLEYAKHYSKSKKAIIVRKNHYAKNKEKILEKNRIRRKTPHARKLANIARNKIYHENINFRISVNIRSRMRKALKNIIKSKHTIEFLGCTIEEFKTYLENKFQYGMTWDNYGYRGWHIDHIIPCSSFNLINPDDQAKCFHYTNLQPLWMKDNIGKGNKIVS